MSGLVIVRAADCRAVMDGSHACAVRWGTDPARVRVYDHHGLAVASLALLTDDEDDAYLMGADFWKTAQSVLRLLSDGCFRANDDLRADLPGIDYQSVLDALVQVGKVEVVDHEEYGVVYMQPAQAKEAQ